MIQPSYGNADNQQTIFPLPDEAYETSYLRFSLSDRFAASAAEARLLWPVLRLPSMKPQGVACQMSRLGQGEFSKRVANHVASFLWFQRDLASAAATHSSVSVDWAGSCRIVWILSLGIYHHQQDRLGETVEEYSNSVGLWIETNKDTFKLLDGFAMSRSTTHQVEVAFQKGDCFWSPSARWFVDVWVDGLLCKTKLWDAARSRFEVLGCPARLHPGELAANLDHGGPHASIVVEWIGSCGEVTDLRTHSGELIRCSDPQHQLAPRIEASTCSQVESACIWERYECPDTGSLWWWHSDTGHHFHESTGSPTREPGQQSVWQSFRSPNHGGAVWWWNSLSNEFFFTETGSPEQPAWC